MVVSGVRRSWEMLVMEVCNWAFPCLKQCCMARSCSRDWLSVSARRHKSLSRQESVIGVLVSVFNFSGRAAWISSATFFARCNRIHNKRTRTASTTIQFSSHNSIKFSYFKSFFPKIRMPSPVLRNSSSPSYAMSIP